MGRRLASEPRLHELETIYNEHHRRVRWVLRGRGVADDTLDDLVHDVFVAAFRRMKDRDPNVPMSTWVTGVARNIAFSHRRASARRVAAAQHLPAPDDSIGPDEEVARGQAWRELQAFLAGLDEEQREVFVLAECLGMRVPEVAAVVDAPLNTLYSRLRIARQRFGDRFGPEAKEQLRRASASERPSDSQQRHAWLLISTTVVPNAAGPVAVAAGASSVVSKWLAAGGIAMATIGAGVGLRSVVRSSTPVARTAVREAPADRSAALEPGAELSPASDRDAEATVAEAGTPTGGTPPRLRSASADAPASGPAPTPTPHSTAVRAKPAKPAVVEDPLTEAVEALRAAQRRLKLGKPAAALRTLDALSTAASAFMQRERYRIERQAACAVGNVGRAERAHNALAASGEVVSGDACKKVTTP